MGDITVRTIAAQADKKFADIAKAAQWAKDKIMASRELVEELAGEAILTVARACSDIELELGITI